jgi:hypothetical protein
MDYMKLKGFCTTEEIEEAIHRNGRKSLPAIRQTRD